MLNKHTTMFDPGHPAQREGADPPGQVLRVHLAAGQGRRGG